MLKKNNRDIIYFFIVLSLLLSGALYLSSSIKNKSPDYSVLNKSNRGISVFFNALQQLNYPTERNLGPIYANANTSIVIATSGIDFSIETPALKSWVENGGKLIYLTEGVLNPVIYNKLPEKNGSFYYYKFNNGTIITGDVTLISNNTLLKNTNYAYELLNAINSFSPRNICFNESALFSSNSKITLWDYIPVEYKFLLYQLLLVVAAYIFFRSKRFGRPIPFFEEVERTQNEYLYSSASLYQRGECWDLMLEHYCLEFKSQFPSSSEDWLSVWQREELPGYDKAKKLYTFLQLQPHKINTKEYMQWIKVIDELTYILKKRRDSYWKSLTRLQ